VGAVDNLPIYNRVLKLSSSPANNRNLANYDSVLIVNTSSSQIDVSLNIQGITRDKYSYQVTVAGTSASTGSVHLKIYGERGLGTPLVDVILNNTVASSLRPRVYTFSFAPSTGITFDAVFPYPIS
jgi:hypothetical protein